jgi:hypothetical protein
MGSSNHTERNIASGKKSIETIHQCGRPIVAYQLLQLIAVPAASSRTRLRNGREIGPEAAVGDGGAVLDACRAKLPSPVLSRRCVSYHVERFFPSGRRNTAGFVRLDGRRMNQMVVSLSGIGPRGLMAAPSFLQQSRSVEWQVAGIKRPIAPLGCANGESNAIVKDWSASWGGNDENPTATQS